MTQLKKTSGFGVFAARKPFAPVMVRFRNEEGQEGTLVGDAAFVLEPCASMRYFPHDRKAPADYGWPVPYWYAEEIVDLAEATPDMENAAWENGTYFGYGQATYGRRDVVEDEA